MNSHTHTLQSEVSQLERRRRQARPPLLLAFALFFLLMPIINYVGRVFYLQSSFGDWHRVTETFGWRSTTLLLLGPAVSLGLLWKHRAGWYLFLVYAPSLLLHNVLAMISAPGAFNIGALVQTAIAFAAIGYFLRKDTYAPLLADEPRGWRRNRRVTLNTAIEIANHEYRTRDLNARSCFVLWQDCSLRPSSEVQVRLHLAERVFDLRAGVARVQPTGVALAFRDVPPQQARELEQALAEALRRGTTPSSAGQ